MRRVLIATLFVTSTLAGLSASAQAADWMFRKSYYSHNDGPSPIDGELPSRSAIRDPWVGAHPKFAVRGGWRFNTFTINNGTGSTDRTYFRENFYDVNY
jgi:hypothetical protein